MVVNYSWKSKATLLWVWVCVCRQAWFTDIVFFFFMYV